MSRSTAPAEPGPASPDGDTSVEQMLQSAAAPSPFPPIAEYAFLSNCHTSALVAPDGSMGWLCVPSFDAPSVFGTLLDRGAGSFRMAPFGIDVPALPPLRPGDDGAGDDLALPDGVGGGAGRADGRPAPGEDTSRPHTRPPADVDGDHLLVRTVECHGGSVEIELVCEPVFDYGRTPATWTLQGDDRHVADATGAGVELRLTTDMALGIEGGRVRARHVLQEGEKLFCTISWAEGLQGPPTSSRPRSA